MREILAFAFLAAACATAPVSPLPTAEAVVAAERWFAAYAGQNGWIPAFRAFAAPDGVVIPAGQIRNAREVFNALADDGARGLNWWPASALISRSGDLGFTTGPYVREASGAIRGQYFTVWRKQPDGNWQWLFDGGTGTAEPVAIPHEGPVPSLLVATSGAASAAEAIAQVIALETAHANSASLVSLLAGNARVLRPTRAPAIGAPAAMADMILPSGEVAYAPERQEASSGGDLVFTIGTAHWTAPTGEARQGHYVRIWQHQGDGWRIVADELLPAPPPAPATPAPG